MKKVLSFALCAALSISMAMGLTATAGAAGTLLNEEFRMPWMSAPEGSLVFYVTQADTNISSISITRSITYRLSDFLDKEDSLTMKISKYSYNDLYASFPKDPQTVIATSKVTMTTPDGSDLSALAAANDGSEVVFTGQFGVTLGYGTYRVELSPKADAEDLIEMGCGFTIYGTGGVKYADEGTGVDIKTFCMGMGCSFQDAEELYKYWASEWQGEQDRLMDAANARAKAEEARRAAEYAAKPISLKVNGYIVKCDSPPIIESGRTLVPVRALCEALGYDVTWDQDTQTVCILSHFTGAAVMDFVVNSRVAYVAYGDTDYTITMDVPARIVNNRVLIPARAVSEALGFQVSWDQNSKTVIIQGAG